jgi:hypothetical protein
VNPYERAARMSKAAKIATALAERGITAADLPSMTSAERALVCCALRVRHASDQTWAVVAELLGAVAA